MDPIGLGLAFIASMWVFDINEQQNAIIEKQQTQIEQMDKTILKLAGSHAASVARLNGETEDNTNGLKDVESRLNYLEQKVDIYHD